MERNATVKLVCVKLPVNRLFKFNSVCIVTGYCLFNSAKTSVTNTFSKELSLFTQVGALSAKDSLFTILLLVNIYSGLFYITETIYLLSFY